MSKGMLCCSFPALDECVEMSFICVFKSHALERRGTQKPERDVFWLVLILKVRSTSQKGNFSWEISAQSLTRYLNIH